MGMGSCGLCHIRLIKGDVNPPTETEKVHLNQKELEKDMRLACQIHPRGDLEIVILSPAKRQLWTALQVEKDWRQLAPPATSVEKASSDVVNPYGAAVDIGTTHITISLSSLNHAIRIAGRYGINPQMSYGTDIMTRLIEANKDGKTAEKMRTLLFDAIADALLDISGKEGINLHQVTRLMVVGNTAMLALLSGKNYDRLLKPGNWMTYIDCLPEDTSNWRFLLGIHHQASIEVIPPLAGFVGSDLLSGVIYTEMTKDHAKKLLIDFGTNSEIALWDGRQLKVTSAAGGPAFEGSGLSCGYPAEPGGINAFRFDNNTIDFSVIGDVEPRGICGSGIIDLIAGLIANGRLNKLGQLTDSVGAFTISKGQPPIALSKGDVDIVQRAKSAVATGIRVLLMDSGIDYRELDKVLISGAFGSFLNVDNAKSIGLLPPLDNDHFELTGNTALKGCELLLSSPKAYDSVIRTRDEAAMINLSKTPDFDRFFLENLYLQPMN